MSEPAIPATAVTTRAEATARRIPRRFGKLAEAGEMGLVAYITAGDPSLAASEKIVLAAAEAGADVIELGVPFSDPVADGPTIQRASERALRSGTTLAGVIELVRRLRLQTDVPLMLFSYFNPILQMGLEKFADAAAKAGADGVLATDLTPEEAGEYRAAIASARAGYDFSGGADLHGRASRENRGIFQRLSVPDFANGSNRRAGISSGGSSVAGPARAAVYEAAAGRRLRDFSARACNRAGRNCRCGGCGLGARG